MIGYWFMKIGAGAAMMLLLFAFASQGEPPWHKRCAWWSIPFTILFCIGYVMELHAFYAHQISAWLTLAVLALFVASLFGIVGPGNGRRIKEDYHVLFAVLVLVLGAATGFFALNLFGHFGK